MSAFVMITSGVAPESHAATSVRSSRLCVSGRSTGTTIPTTSMLAPRTCASEEASKARLRLSSEWRGRMPTMAGSPAAFGPSQTQSPVAGSSPPRG